MTHPKTKRRKLLGLVIFCLLIAGSFSLHKNSETLIQTANAADPLMTPASTTTQTSPLTQPAATNTNSPSLLNSGNNPNANSTSLLNVTPTAQTTTPVTSPLMSTGAGNPVQPSLGTESKSGATSGYLNDLFAYILRAILKLMGVLISIATTLFNWMIDSNNMKSVLTNAVIYTTWALVRDTLNVAFILVLLFSAFSTVFQVDKYSYKKLLLTLVLMALLVNFSYPIALFIIDFSNSMMYYLLNSAGIGLSNAKGAFPSIADGSTLAGILNTKSNDITLLLADIIFVWILAVTLLIIGCLFVIRTVMLAILIIFSSLAFTGSIVPFLSKYSSQWWDNLFKYAFFGPVMVFMLGISVQMMKAINTAGMPSMTTLAGEQSVNSSWLASASFFIIPIIILWAGIIFAQSMSLMGANAVIGRGQKLAKWGGAAVGASAWWGAKQTGIPGGISKKWENYKKTGPLFGSNVREEREARHAGKGLFAVPNAIDEADAKRIKEAKEKHDMEHMLTGDLQNIKKTGNKFEQAAAIQELANKGQAGKADLDQIRTAFGGSNSQAFKQLQDKVKTYNPVAAFSHLSVADQKANYDDFMKSNQFDSKKINADSWKDATFMEAAITTGGVNGKDMEEILKKNPTTAKQIKSVLSSTADNHIGNNDVDKGIQLLNFSQNGSLSTSALNERHIQDHVFSNLSGETGSNIDQQTANSYKNEILSNIKPAKLTDFVRNIKNVQAQKEILSEIKTRATTATHPQNAIYKKHAAALMKDASLAGAYAAA